MTIYLSSDFHINHKNICCKELSTWSHGYRNFKSIEEMNAVILDNINSVVQPEDILYFLGDFAFGDKTVIPSLRDKIKCRNIIGLKGNHDDKLWKNYRNIYVESYKYHEFRYRKVLFCLCHYPISEWNEIERGSIMLHGHTHRFNTDPRRVMDVGVDPNEFKPLSIDQVMDIMSTRVVGNHHEAR